MKITVKVKGIIIGVLSLILLYLAYSFGALDFNLLNWTLPVRITFSFIGLAIVGFIFGFLIMDA